MRCKDCALVNDCLRVAELNGTVLDIKREHSCRCYETEFKALQRAGVRKARLNPEEYEAEMLRISGKGL